MATREPDGLYLQNLQCELRQLGRRIAEGDESQLLVWILTERLACSHRPLRHNRLYGGSARTLDPGATPLIRTWIAQIREEGIRSIICLLSEEEVDFYGQLDLGASNLLEFYRQKGFSVASIPWKDPAHVRTDPQARRKKEQEVSASALEKFKNLPKPVLLHCSAGIDCSAPVAAYIRERVF